VLTTLTVLAVLVTLTVLAVLVTNAWVMGPRKSRRALPLLYHRWLWATHVTVVAAVETALAACGA
jgi:hypothetical protein